MSELVQKKGSEGKAQNAFGKMLDSYFHFTDRGSSAGREIKAGLGMFFLSVCALFMNIQIVAGAFEDDIPYCGLYLGATITAFIGTMLIGFVCNLPLVQTSSLSMSTIMISVIGTDSGLTYANLLAVTFTAALVYLVVMLLPPVKRAVTGLIPDSVRKALPVAMGLYIVSVAFKNMGLIEDFSLASFSDSALGGASIAPYMRLCMATGLIAFAIVLFRKKIKSETPIFSGFLWSTLVFFLIAAVMGGIAFSYVYTQNRIWVGINPDPLGEMYTIAGAIKEMLFGTLFREGFDFSAFTEAGGSVAGLFGRTIIMFVLLGMYESEASVLGADMNGQIMENNYEKHAEKFLFVNALTNVVAPVFGSAPVSVGKQSSASAADGAKTGLASVVCGLGFLISMFTWLPFVVFSVYTKSVPEYGHAGFVFPNVIYAGFQIADAMMLFLGLMMLKGVRVMADMDISDAAAFGITVAVTAYTQNIAYGAAAGVIVYIISKLTGFSKKEIKEISAAKYMMAVICAVFMTLSFAMPLVSAETKDTAAIDTASDGQTAPSGETAPGGDTSMGGEAATGGDMSPEGDIEVQ